MTTIKLPFLGLALFAVALFCLPGTTLAQSEEDLIREAVTKYIDGTAINDPDLIKEAFWDEARMFLHHPEQEIFLRSAAEYADGFSRFEKGEPNGRTGKVLSVERDHDLALVRAEIRLPPRDEGGEESVYIDVFILKKLASGWKILSKAATRLQ